MRRAGRQLGGGPGPGHKQSQGLERLAEEFAEAFHHHEVKNSTESKEPSLRCKAGVVAKCWVELGGFGRRETRGGPLVSRRTIRGWSGVQMMERASLGKRCPGGCVFLAWQIQRVMVSCLQDLIGQLRPSGKLNSPTSRISLHIRNFHLGPDSGNAGPSLAGLFPSEVRTGELLRYPFSPLAAGNLRAACVFRAEHLHSLGGIHIRFRFPPGFILCSYSNLCFCLILENS